MRHAHLPTLLLALVLTLTASGCVHSVKSADETVGPAAAAESAGPVDGLTEAELSRLLPGVDSSRLTPKQRADLADFAEDAMCPCAPTSLAECIRDGAACTPVARMVELSQRLIVAGQPPFLVTTRVESYVHSFSPARRREVAALGASKGPEDAPVILVEFSDFQCPACRAAHPALTALVEKYPDTVRVVFRHFPLPQHEHAEAAARASVHAEQHGRFWEFATLAFERADRLDEAGLREIATEIGLDPDALWRAVDDAGPEAARVEADKSAGRALAIPGTPTLFVNGRPYALPVTLEYLSWTVEDELDWLANGGAWAAQ